MIIIYSLSKECFNYNSPKDFISHLDKEVMNNEEKSNLNKR